MGYTQKPGYPMVARAIFGSKGTGTLHLPRYELRPHSVTERTDHHTDHYVGGQFSHRDTRSSYDTHTVDLMTQVGVDTMEYDTIWIEFEDAENQPLEFRSPWWAHRGDLVYVASHRGVGAYVYELYSAERDHGWEVQGDVTPPIRLRGALIVAALAALFQIQVLKASFTIEFAAIAGGAWFGLQALHRVWRQAMLKRSRRKARRIVAELRREDAPRRWEITSAIRARISG